MPLERGQPRLRADGGAGRHPLGARAERLTPRRRGRLVGRVRAARDPGAGMVAAWRPSARPTPALELAAALRAREVSAVELLDACLAAVDELNPTLNAVTWRNDEQARAGAAEADRRLADGDDAAPFLGVPMPIKDLTPVAGWPVTYGSHGAPEGPSERSELVVDALVDAGFVLCARTNTPAFGVITAAENSRLRDQPQPVGHRAHAGRLQRRRRGGGRRRHVPDRPRQRRRRLDSHPRLLLRPGRAEAEPRPRAAPGAELARRGRRGRRHAHRRRLGRRARHDLATSIRSPGTTRPRPRARSPRSCRRRPGSCASA